MVGPIDVKQKENEATLTRVLLTLTFDLEFSRSNCISGMGGPVVLEQKGRPGVDRMPWCETLRKWVNWTLRWLGYLWPWILTLNFQGQIVSREWEARWACNDRDGSRQDVLMRNTKDMSHVDAALTGVPLTLIFDLEFSRSDYIWGMGGPIITPTIWPRDRGYY